MPFINDPEVTTFSDTHLRQAVDRLFLALSIWRDTVAEYNLSIAGNAAFVAAAGGDFIGDQNGTTNPYTKDDLINTITRFNQLLDGAAGFEAGGGLNGANMLDAPQAIRVRTVD